MLTSPKPLDGEVAARAAWTARIAAAWRKSVERILEAGRPLIDAKRTCHAAISLCTATISSGLSRTTPSPRHDRRVRRSRGCLRPARSKRGAASRQTTLAVSLRRMRICADRRVRRARRGGMIWPRRSRILHQQRRNEKMANRAIEVTNAPIEAKADPFDLASLRLDPSFIETAGVKKLLTTVPVGQAQPARFRPRPPGPGISRQFCDNRVEGGPRVFHRCSIGRKRTARRVRFGHALHGHQPARRSASLADKIARPGRTDHRVA